MFCLFSPHILPAAVLLDLILGDPRSLPHPIRWMGQAISYLEPRFRNLPIPLTFSGALFCISLVTGTWMATAVLVYICAAVHPAFGKTAEVLLIYYAVSAISLQQSAMDVFAALAGGDLKKARKKVGMIIGRDTGRLDSGGVTRGAVESVAENFVDGVAAPLFFAAIGGAPLAMAFKMINTLDSMVGYKNRRYRSFGLFSARMDDVVNYIPARLSIGVITAASLILNRRHVQTWRTARQEGANHASPNAGYPEAAFAGALGVRLNGPNTYGGVLVDKPFIGRHFAFPQTGHIPKACDLMLLSSTLWTMLLWGMVWITA